MNILKFLLLVLSNSRGEVGFSEVEDHLDESTLSDLGLGDDQADEQSETDSTEGEGNDLDSMLKDFDSEKESEDGASEDSSLLDGLNALGILREGLPVEFGDIDSVKELISKGNDYTFKTQELANERTQMETDFQTERTAFETERTQFQEEMATNQANLNNYGILQRVIADLQNSEPEMFEELNSMFLQQERQVNDGLNNPAFTNLQQQLTEMQTQLTENSNEAQEKQNAEIRDGWDNEVKTVQTDLGPKLKSLGIKPNWEKVKAAWEADSTSKLTVKSALYAIHGEDIQKALNSSVNLEKTRRSKRAAGSTGATDKPVFGSESGSSYLREAMKIAEGL